MGKDLDALIPGGISADVRKNIADIDVSAIKRNRYQPRGAFDKGKIEELAQSIKENGVIQPLIVRKLDEGYELIIGERRLRAAALLEMPTVPAIVIEASDEKILEMALVENIQRDDLNPMDCAVAFKQLADRFNLTQEQIATRVGKERATITNYMRLSGLSSKVQRLLREEKLTFGHAKALLSLDDTGSQELLAGLVVAEGLSVRKCEELATGKNKAGKTKTDPRPAEQLKKDYYLEAIEDRFQQVLGTKVKISPKKNGGVIEIQYYASEDLERILNYFDFEEELE